MTEMKFAFDSAATALARRVLPQPGGPQRRMPVGEVMPTAVKRAGSLIWSTMATWSSSRTDLSAPMLSQVVSGIVAKPSRFDDGTMFGRTERKASIGMRIACRPSGSWSSSFLARAMRWRSDVITVEVVGAWSTSMESSLSMARFFKVVLYCFIVHAPAFPTKSRRSAPTNPPVILARTPKSTSSANAVFLV